MSLEAIYEDRWLRALVKPAGLLTHRTALDAHETQDALTQAQTQWGERLWPAHRLDKGTSGLLLLARDAATAQRLGPLWREGRVHKRYLAWVRGWPASESGRIDHPLARDPERPSQGQLQLPARTDWTLLARRSLPLRTHPAFAETRCALLALCPHEGRRHQLRRHCKQLAHPILGDATHGKGPLNRALAAWLGQSRLWLHAQDLVLPHPVTGAPLRLHAPPGPAWEVWAASAA